MIYVVYFLLATPVEFLAWFSIRGAPQSGCLLFLNCGSYFEAAVILGCVAVLKANTGWHDGLAGKRVIAVFSGVAAGLIASLLWGYIFSWTCRHFAQQYFIPGTQPWSGGYYPGQLGAAIAYYRFFSIFIAFYLSIVAADLLYRNLKDDSLSNWASPAKVKSAGGFVWISWVTWLVLYRFSEWVLFALALMSKSRSVSLDAPYLIYFPLIATSIACIPISFWLYRHQPKTRQSSVSSAQIASLLIPVLAAPLLLPGGFLIVVPVAFCLRTLNVAGFVWGWIVGDLRWRSQAQQKLLINVQ